MTHVIRPFFHGESIGAIFAALRILQICNICILVQIGEVFCTFMHIYAHNMAHKGDTVHILYMATNMGHFCYALYTQRPPKCAFFQYLQYLWKFYPFSAYFFIFLHIPWNKKVPQYTPYILQPILVTFDMHYALRKPQNKHISQYLPFTMHFWYFMGSFEFSFWVLKVLKCCQMHPHAF